MIQRLKVGAVQQWTRMRGWWLASAAALGVVTVIAPHQLTIVVYKLALVTIGVQAVYWSDRMLFRNTVHIDGKLPKDVYGGCRLLARAIVAHAVLSALASGI